MRVRSFGSGSTGNALGVRSGNSFVLVDCGFSYFELSRRMAACGVAPGEVTALVFTHDHSDHCRGLARFHKKHPDVPLCANGATADAIAALTGVAEGWRIFETAQDFELGDFSVTPFSVPHDAADPVGYLFRDAAETLFVATDVGYPTLNVKAAFARATCAVLESNHDAVLLRTSNRPVSLKQRIAGRSGHLSNDDAAELVTEAAAPALRQIFLAHLSCECNAPHLALESVREALARIGRTDVGLAALAPDRPGDLWES